MKEKIYMENYDWIESELARRKAEWMLVVNGQIVKSSRTLNNIPTQPQLDRLGKKKGFVPFLFVRNAPTRTSRNQTRKSILYPDFTNRNADFDSRKELGAKPFQNHQSQAQGFDRQESAFGVAVQNPSRW